ncbi:MAG: sigma-54 dependent transcriptional regulator [Acidobacteriota bacterium]|nr:sigma-54 dependent transcriptional regulator [Acidobacteriota bacterium]MDQ7088332.1 sigma-54 dependent transcriptional regulator [Acidobacteriota bacterium]
MPAILVVDDEPGIRAFLRGALENFRAGWQVSEASDGGEALERLEQQDFHLMITDLKMPGVGGMDVLTYARRQMPEMEVIVLTAHGSVESAVQAMKLGAFDYLTKPLSGPEELRLLVGRALERRRLRSLAQSGAAVHEATSAMIAVDPRSRSVMELIRKVAPEPTTVLLLGESGTGKEVAAREIHRLSPRSGHPFVAVNCAAVSAGLVESELFGHEKGAFTGADQRRRGRFELADGGTLFLDEVAEMPVALQAKLLRVLDERVFERVGGNRRIQVDVRILAATNRDLDVERAAGRMREDLYHRLAAFPITLPPLRERSEDLEPLARHLLARLSRQLGRPRLNLGPGVLARLRAHDWPGNVRELGNVLERAAILAPGDTIEVGHLALEPAGGATAPALEGTLRDIEKEAIRRALAACQGHRRKAAQRLGIGLRTLYEKIKTYGLS